MTVVKNKVFNNFYQRYTPFKMLIDFICNVIIPERYQGEEEIE